MSKNIDNYLVRLKKFYEQAGDEYSLKLVERDIKSVEYIRQMDTFKNNPMAKKLYDSAVDRFKACASKLLNKKEMTQEERNLTFLDMDWARWYISGIGGDPTEMEKVLEKEVETQIQKLNL